MLPRTNSCMRLCRPSTALAVSLVLLFPSTSTYASSLDTLVAAIARVVHGDTVYAESAQGTRLRVQGSGKIEEDDRMNWLQIMNLVAGIMVAVGTLVLAVVAVFQDRIRSYLSRPNFLVSVRTEPPDCTSVPLSLRQTGQRLGDAMYLRIWVENRGNTPARQVEVYAGELRRQQADQTWRRVPPEFDRSY